MSASLPLKGIKVVEICHSVAGPYGGLILAKLGADLIKVENPDHGDHARGWGPPYWHGTAAIFQSLNSDKRSVTVDFTDPEQLAQLKRLILRDADVVVQNLRPGAVDRYGLSGAELLHQKADLIYCNLGAFGASGPLRDRPGYDPLMQAFGGIMSVTGEEGRAPVRVGPAIVDMGSGMWAAIGILAALHRRQATGRGCIVDTSLYETALAWMTVQVAGYLASGEVRRPMGSGIVEIVPHQAFATADGYIMVAAGNDALFRKLTTAIGRSEWADDPQFATNDGRVRNRQSLVTALSAIFVTECSTVWAARLDEAGVPTAPIQTVDRVVSHPQTEALDIVQAVPGLDMRLVGVPLSFDGVRPSTSTAAPKLGEHTATLLFPKAVERVAR